MIGSHDTNSHVRHKTNLVVKRRRSHTQKSHMRVTPSCSVRVETH